MEKMPFRDVEIDMDVQAVMADAATVTTQSDWRQALPMMRGAMVTLRDLRLSGVAAVAHASVLLFTRLAYLAVGAVLLRVLWAPIGERVEHAGFDPAVALLLVGFVAIWLCLVLGGGALHAWGSVTWTGVLGTRIGGEGRSAEQMETISRP